MKATRTRMGIVALAMCFGLMIYVYWPARGFAVAAIEKMGGVVAELTTLENNGRVAVTFPDGFNDEMFEKAAVLERLQPVWIQLQGKGITRRSILTLKRYPYLRGLTLSRTRVLDDDIAELAAFPELNTVNLDGSPITDEGLQYIGKLPALRSLSVRGTAVTKGAIDKLQTDRPGLLLFSNFTPDDD